MIANPCRLLVIEDEESDFRLLERHLRRAAPGAVCRWVSTRAQLQQALAEGGWSLALADRNLPGLPFADTMALLHEAAPWLRVVLVSGTIDESMAAELLRQGVSDFVLKENLARMGPAVERGLRETEEREARVAAEAALRQSEARLQLALEAAQLAVWEWDRATDRMVWSPAWVAEKAATESGSSWLGFVSLIHPDDRPGFDAAVATALATRTALHAEWRVVRDNGVIQWFSTVARVTGGDLTDPQGLVGTLRDVTDLKRAEREARGRLELQDQLAKVALSVPGVVYSFHQRADGSFCMPFAAEAIEAMCGFSREILANDMAPVLACIHEHDVADVVESIYQSEQCWEPWHSVFRYEHPSTGLRWIEGRSVPTHQDDGGITWHGFMMDITERKRQEQAEREAEERLKQAMAAAQMGTWTWDVQADRCEWSAEWCGLVLGVSDPGPTRNGVMHWVHPDDTARVDAGMSAVLRDGQTLSIEYRLLRPDGRVRWIWQFGRGWFDEQGGPLRVAGGTRDITPLREAQEARDVSERLLQQVIDQVPHFIFAKDQDGRYLFANRACAEASGLTPETMIGRRDVELRADPAEAERYRRDDLEVIATGLAKVKFEEPMTDAVGQARVMQTTKVPFRAPGNPDPAVLGVSADITELKQAQAAIGASEAKFRSYVELAPHAIFVADGRGRYVDFNRAALELLGYTSEELHDLGVVDITPDDDMENALGSLKRLVETGRAEGQHILRRKDGSRVWVSLLGVCVGPDRYMAHCEDISERLAHEAALRESEQRLQTILHTALDGFWLADLDGRLLEVNDAYCTVSGYSRAELLTMRIADLEALEQPCDVADRIARIRSAGLDSFETRHRRKDGGLVDIEMRVQLDPARGGQMVCFARDITERKQAEAARRALQAQFLQSQKMEAVGRLAGGVAHDFNNMLGVILGYCDLALAEVASTHPLHEGLVEIAGAARRSADLTRQLLAFSRQQVTQPIVLDLNAQLRGMERLLQRILGEDMRLQVELSEALWPVRLDPSQVDQVVANLSVNARDAMPQGGTLTVRTRNESVGRADAVPDALEPGDYVVLAIADTGCGMDGETVQHLFEPFYTTKEEGKGTGLGLATVYGIVQQNHGHIDVETVAGAGTTVRVYLPRHCGEEPSSGAQPRPDGHATGHETVLLVEDQPQVRKLARMMLRRLGYQVIDAATADDALMLCSSQQPHVDVLLTDVVMPAMSGWELASRLQELRPGLKALFMSGYSSHNIVERGILDRDVVFIEKPFSVAGLGIKVREALDR